MMTTTKPAYHGQDDFQTRLKKLEEIRELGVNPFPPQFDPQDSAQTLHAVYAEEAVGSSEDAAGGLTPKAVVSGRLILFRAMGKNAFGHIQDATGKLQVMFNRDITSVTDYDPSNSTSNQPITPIKFIEKKLDLGDIIGIEGHLFRTQKGELTLFATSVTLLCKSLLPLADKHSGLHDKELRYRKRWLDLICNPEVSDTFRTRSRIVKAVRNYFEKAGFMEVETPCLQSNYGGAEARPFTTKLNALDQEMFLRISLEIPLKKLIVGGMDRIFEIGKVFRNEGIDRTHNPEFTMLEAYAASWDYNAMMVLLEQLFEQIALDLFGSTQVPGIDPSTGNTVQIEMKAPWKRVSMKESLAEYAALNIDSLTDDAIRTLLIEEDKCDPLVIAKLPRGLLIAELFETRVEEKLIQPHHIIDHPVETTPLCKPHRDPAARAEGLVERFETFILGGEICNSYTELNDPELQRTLLEQQAAKKEQGDEEAHPLDEEFIEAICQGMPPTGGIGIGIDRMVMLFTQATTIRDVLYFPWMRPVEDSSDQD